MLDVVKTAAPCDEFCHFATNSQDKRLDKQALKETLQFLEHGRRGFLLTLGCWPGAGSCSAWGPGLRDQLKIDRQCGAGYLNQDTSASAILSPS